MNKYPHEWIKDSYLNSQILTYIGNKRKLLPMIYEALIKTQIPVEQSTFIDLFSGSGIVSRLAKKMGFHRIITNDWEFYSETTNSLFIKENTESIKELFISKGGLQVVLNNLNNLPSNNIIAPYISRYYAPQSAKQFDTQKERLFYTPENAKKIDIIRDTIEEWYPSKKQLTPLELREKNLLVALLLYKASIHTNTSGVFKAYYKEYGGYGRNALSRILAPIMLEMPVLSSSSQIVDIYRGDAIDIIKKYKTTTSYSIVYLDPPYNIHQYGSNYHMLNTISIWDKMNLDYTYTQDGYLKEKSAIRNDWKERHSPFCSVQTATKSFENLINSINADRILISYSSDGIIALSTMLNILIHKGSISLLINPYIKYRGGKKGEYRKNHNIEFILTVNTHENGTSEQIQNILQEIEDTRWLMGLQGIYKHLFIKEYFTIQGSQLLWKKNPKIILELGSNGEFKNLIFLPITPKEKINLQKDLHLSQCHTKIEEVQELIMRYKSSDNQENNLKLLLKTMKYLAYKKYALEFQKNIKTIHQLISQLSAEKKQNKYLAQLDKLEFIYYKRVS